MMGIMKRLFYSFDFIVCWSLFYLFFLFLHLPLPLTFLSNPYLEVILSSSYTKSISFGFNFIIFILIYDAEADRTSPQSETDGQGQGQGQSQEGTYTDTSKSGYPVTDEALCNQSLSSIKHPTHNTQVPHFAREQPGYLYNMRGSHISDSGTRGVLEIPAGHTQCKPESTSEMKGFGALSTPNTNLINYNINLQSMEGGSLEGYNQGQGQGQGQGHDGSPGWHGNPHNPAHSHLHSHALQPDLGGLPLSHRQQPHPNHHHQTSEGNTSSMSLLRIFSCL